MTSSTITTDKSIVDSLADTIVSGVNFVTKLVSSVVNFFFGLIKGLHESYPRATTIFSFGLFVFALGFYITMHMSMPLLADFMLATTLLAYMAIVYLTAGEDSSED